MNKLQDTTQKGKVVLTWIIHCHRIKDATESIKFKISNPATHSKLQIDILHGNLSMVTAPSYTLSF